MRDMQWQVQQAIDGLVDSGAERGVQVAVYQHGKLTVDAVAGLADPTTGRPYTSGTLCYVTSTGKGMISTVVHTLAERGVLTYDTRIAELWPEFGANGKDAATIRDALTFALGVPGLPVDTTPADLADWDTTCRRIAEAQPWWEPGTTSGYHPQTFMFIVGEIVRRATGSPISQILHDLVAAPLGIADELFLGLPASELERLARIEDPPAVAAAPPPDMPADIPFFRVVHGYTAAPLAALPTAEFSNRPDILMSDGTGASTSARALARMYAAVVGEVDGVRLLSPERLREATAVAFRGIDELVGVPTTLSLGYGVGLPGSGPQDSATWFGWGGSGGTAAYADTATGTAIAMTKNRAAPGDFTTFGRVAEIVAGT
jgi:CubicO group peptidase (beta-lactamase class C family)